jgi:osmoprotectant transport system substrate-binding protein
MKRTVAMLAAATTLLLAACGSGNPTQNPGGNANGSGTITVGSADFPESVLLMELYAAALRNAGATVATHRRIGSREAYVKALQDGSLSVVPEYSGNLLYYLDTAATATTSDEVYSALRQKAPSSLAVLAKSQAEDKDVLVVSPATAQQLGLRSMADLGPKCPQLVLGAAGEWKGRWEKKIKDLYRCTFKEIRTTDAAGPVTVNALKDGSVQVANLFTTASAIKANNFVQLADPKQMYPAQDVVPLVRKDVLNDKQRQALDALSAALNTDNLTQMVRRVEVDKENASDIAAEFLKQMGH